MATTSPGRNQRDAMERLVRLLAVLNTGGKVGVSAERLIRDGHYGEGDAGSQLNRDFRHLREQGWQIENVADSGEDGRYVLVAGDNRLRLTFTPAQQAALRQAALLADRDDLAHGFVPHDVAVLHARNESAVQVQIRPADGAAGHSNDGVTTILDLRVGDLLAADRFLAVPAQRFHGLLPGCPKGSVPAAVCSVGFQTQDDFRLRRNAVRERLLEKQGAHA